MSRKGLYVCILRVEKIWSWFVLKLLLKCCKMSISFIFDKSRFRRINFFKELSVRTTWPILNLCMGDPTQSEVHCLWGAPHVVPSTYTGKRGGCSCSPESPWRPNGDNTGSSLLGMEIHFSWRKLGWVSLTLQSKECPHGLIPLEMYTCTSWKVYLSEVLPVYSFTSWPFFFF